MDHIEKNEVALDSAHTSPSRAEVEPDEAETSSTTVTENEEALPETEQLTRLASRFSLRSMQSDSYIQDNPFIASDATLDPKSPQFNARKWTQSLIRTSAQDPTRYPQYNLGVCWRDLNVHGFGSSTDYQKDVLNVLWRGALIIKERLSNRRRKIQILRNFDGLIKSGETLVVLGRPGSGVSTLLKVLAGQSHGLYLEKDSVINYQGIPWDVMHKNFRGEVIYQAETDIHFPELTVGQTLLFAALARTPKNRFPGVTRQKYAEQLRDVVMAVFGISNTINTKVGNDFIRGVSGGERKRVSIAEATLSRSRIQCWDNSTRGLDSATALEFTKLVRLSADIAGTSAIVAIYQASQSAYDLFDKVTVLYEGRQIYFGSKDAAKKYFTDLGYHCPERQITADFLTSLTNPSERIVQPGFEGKVPRTPDEFAGIWRKSETRRQLLQDIEAFEREAINDQPLEKFRAARQAEKDPMIRKESPYTISVPKQVSICVTRGFQRIWGNKTFFLITVLGNLVMSLILGSTFYDLPFTAETLNSRCVLLYFIILFNALSSSLEILTLYAQRPIVEKHAGYALYHPLSDALSSIICELPSKVLSTIAFNVPVYFMAKLRQDAGHFFIFLLFGFTCTLSMSMILRTIGQTSRTIHQALTPAAMFILTLVIYTGFIIPTRNMQDWLRWINYLNPIAYAYESLVANEFHDRHFPCSEFIPMGPGYQNISATERTCYTAGAAPGADFVSGDVYMNGSFGYYYSHLWRNFGILIGFISFFTFIYLFAAEYITTSPSKGEVLVFRRKHKTNEIPATDPESSSVEPTRPGQSDDFDDTLQIKLEQQESIFHWQNLTYDITIKGEDRRILDQINGWVKPGTLTALMGATGAGKTTLLDVLADRVTMGVVTGDILVNGHPRGDAFQRKIGYVQQQDIHLETSTVREALRFSAALRQPSEVPTEDKYAYVENVIKLLGMEAYADAVVGVPGEGLNVEQRKRLTIAVELAAKPKLLVFLDEPTSGLDSQTAWSIITLIKKLSDNGQAILCTIHQPSALLFQQFDRILLLAKGGKTVYFGDLGENSTSLIRYFESYGAPTCNIDENPAEWMLRVIGAAPGAHTDRDWADTWRNSEQYAAVKRQLHDLQQNSTAASDMENNLDEAGNHVAPLSRQVLLCGERVFKQYWRTPSYIYAKLILCGGMSLIIGVSFYKAQLSILGLQDQMFSIFMLLVIFAFLCYQTMPNFVLQRQQYEARERASKTYSWITFVLVNIIVELPWNTIAALLIFFPFYYLVGMYQNAEPTHEVAERGGLMFLLTWSFLLFQSTFTDMIIAGIETAEVGATAALILFAVTLLFAGVMVPASSLPGFWIFMYRVSPFTYLISAMMSTGIANTQVKCADIELLTFQPPVGQTCEQYMAPFIQMAGGEIYNPNATSACEFCSIADTNTYLASVDSYYSDRWRDFGIIWAYIIFNIFATIFLYWLARVPKKTSLSQILREFDGKGGPKAEREDKTY